ncbi:hypothetical protein ACERIT_12090 [Halopenitus sp. H-Gu1]|uniref:hypothetical protein n=1 Tax=Halopenitus sp. H-Gu1 TaxID=3242697 RepID=UPI00359EABA9
MRVRDAVEDDAEAIAAISGRPVDAVREMIHDRSIRVGLPDRSDQNDRSDPDEKSRPDPIGYVAFDARRDTVHVTGFGGSEEAITRLFEEPKRFASGEGLSLEVIVDQDETRHRTLLEEVGFERAGAGPRFEGTPTVRYRIPANDREK